MSEPAEAAPALLAAPVSLWGIVLGLALLAGGVVLLGFELWSLVDGVVVVVVEVVD